MGIGAAVVAGGGGGSQGPLTPKDIQTGPPPWSPETSDLQARLSAMGLPSEGEAYHVHAVLRVFADGKQVPLPANIGIDQGSGTMAALHTHDQSGTIHMEAAGPYPFTLGQFFTVWGVKLTRQQLGGLTAVDRNEYGGGPAAARDEDALAALGDIAQQTTQDASTRARTRFASLHQCVRHCVRTTRLRP